MHNQSNPEDFLISIDLVQLVQFSAVLSAVPKRKNHQLTSKISLSQLSLVQFMITRHSTDTRGFPYLS